MANTVNLVTKFLPLVDEKFTTESKKSLLTNTDFDWMGAHSIKIYKISTSSMNDYDRPGEGPHWSRFGLVAGLDAVTEGMTLKKDRSFTFAVDKLDTDETAQQLQAASALERQLREVVIPEVDTYTYGVMCAKLSFETLTATASTDTMAGMAQGVKLFVSPVVTIPAGSKIVVTQCGVTTEYASSGLPAVYPTHTVGHKPIIPRHRRI